MNIDSLKPSKTVKRSVKHVFTEPEKQQLNSDLLNSLADVDTANADFDSVKASCKAKIEEAESRVTTVAATLRAGFEMRTKDCDVFFFPKEKKKVIALAPVNGEAKVVVATEDMTAEDFQAELLLAESAFDERKEIALWPTAGSDAGILVIGQQRNRWFSAVRMSVGQHKLEERLDAEQRAFKQRDDAIEFASKRAKQWLKDNFKEHARGFEEAIVKAVKSENS